MYKKNKHIGYSFDEYLKETLTKEEIMEIEKEAQQEVKKLREERRETDPHCMITQIYQMIRLNEKGGTTYKDSYDLVCDIKLKAKMALTKAQVATLEDLVEGMLIREEKRHREAEEKRKKEKNG